MFCTECGSKIEEGSAFCSNCGAKVAAGPVATEKPEKSPKNPLMWILIVIGVVILLCLIGLGIYLAGKHLSDQSSSKDPKKTEERSSTADDTETAKSEEGQGAKESQTASQGAETSQGTEASQGSQESTGSVEENNIASFEEYYETVLMKKYGEIEYDHSYDQPYRFVEAYNLPKECWFDPNLSGLITYRVLDMDGDGAEEMLAVLLKDSSIQYEVYEMEGGSVKLASTGVFCPRDDGLPTFTDMPEMYLHIYLKEYDGKYCIVERTYEYNYGYGYENTFYNGFQSYDGKTLKPDAVIKYFGDDETAFMITPEHLQALKDHGMESSAEMMEDGTDYFSITDEMDLDELLFVVAYPTDNVDYEEKNAEDDPAFVRHYFYSKEMEYYATFFIVDYQVWRNDHSIASTDELGGIECYCDHISLQLKNKDYEKVLNRELERCISNYDGDDVVSQLNDWYENKAESPYPEEEWVFQPLSIVSVYIEDGYLLSVGYEWDWYMGGVHNFGGFGVNYDLLYDYSVPLSDVLSEGGRKETRQKVIDALCEQTGEDSPESWGTRLDAYLQEHNNHYSYWIDEDYAYLIFDSYSLDQGPGAIQLVLPR
ncbi:MAG: zinc-ribbon domain-containing protein [Lachnospiraceae bacterium]|nr:zinc-ribbon domain-containing protein [Lachnospiraceae bacterium]